MARLNPSVCVFLLFSTMISTAPVDPPDPEINERYGRGTWDYVWDDESDTWGYVYKQPHVQPPRDPNKPWYVDRDSQSEPIRKSVTYYTDNYQYAYPTTPQPLAQQAYQNLPNLPSLPNLPNLPSLPNLPYVSSAQVSYQTGNQQPPPPKTQIQLLGDKKENPDFCCLTDEERKTEQSMNFVERLLSDVMEEGRKMMTLYQVKEMIPFGGSNNSVELELVLVQGDDMSIGSID